MLEVWLSSYLPRALARRPSRPPQSLDEHRNSSPTRSSRRCETRLENLRASRLARSAGGAPLAWVVVDTGSSDETVALAGSLPRSTPGFALERSPRTRPRPRWPDRTRVPGRSSALGDCPDVVVKLDADTSFEPGYFERLLSDSPPTESLGMASGTCHELEGAEWRERHVTGTTVWGASRAYRRECLQAVLPLEQRMGWDGVDEFRANARGWKTRTFKDLPFHHHRREGERDGSLARLDGARPGRSLHGLSTRTSSFFGRYTGFARIRWRSA